MRPLLIIAFDLEPDAPLPWLLWDADNQTPLEQGELSGAGELASLAERSRRADCYILVPGTEATLAEARLPNASRTALQALPYQLEEQLCQDVEQLHIVAGRPLEPGRYPVAVVSKQLMERWSDWVAAASLKVRAMLPDTLALARQAEGPTGLLWRQRALIATPDGKRFATDLAGLEQWWSLASTHLGAPLQLVPTDGDALAGTPAGIELAPPAPSALAYLARQLDTQSGIDLLGEAYRPRQPQTAIGRWRWPALLLLLLLGLGAGTKWWELSRLETRKAALDARVEALFRETFPEVRRIVNPRSQMEYRLTELRRQSQGSDLLALLDTLAPALRATPAIKLQALDYDAGQARLELQYRAPGRAASEALVQRLKGLGLAVTPGAVRPEGAQVRGSLQIQGGR